MTMVNRTPSQVANGWAARRIARPVACIPPDRHCEEVFRAFEADPEILLFPVVTADGKPIGAVERGEFLYRFALPFGRSLYMRRPVTSLMDQRPFVADVDDTITQISHRLVIEKPSALQSGFILTHRDRYVGVAHGIDLVRAMAEHADEAKAEVLHAHEQQYQLLAALPLPLIVVDEATGRLLSVNPRAHDLFLINEETVIKSVQLSRFIDRGDLKTMAQALRRSSSVETHQTQIRRYDGTKLWVLIAAQRLEYLGRPAIAAAIMSVDERRRLEESIRESGERLALAVSATRSGLWDSDFVNDRYYWSPEFFDLLGLAKNALTPDPESFIAMVHPDDRADVTRKIEAHYAGETEQFDGTYRLRHAQGHWLWFDAHGRVLRDATGKATRFTGIMLDVTERYATQEALKLAKERAEQALDELHAAQESLVQSEKLAALGGLVAGVAHEINTPLGTAMTAATALQERVEAFARSVADGKLRRSDLEEFVRTSKDAARFTMTNLTRASELVQSFKMVAVDQSSGSRRSFRLAEYLEEIIMSLSPRLRPARHNLTLDCPRDLVVDSYPGALAQVVTNLVMNALTHAFRPDQIGNLNLVVSSPTPRTARLIFSDDGVGIPPANLQRIFEPFFTTKRGQGGTGLGLHIVYNLVTGQLGGSIRVDSRPGDGTSFVIDLPLVAESNPVRDGQPAQGVEAM